MRCLGSARRTTRKPRPLPLRTGYFWLAFWQSSSLALLLVLDTRSNSGREGSTPHNGATWLTRSPNPTVSRPAVRQSQRRRLIASSRPSRARLFRALSSTRSMAARTPLGGSAVKMPKEAESPFPRPALSEGYPLEKDERASLREAIQELEREPVVPEAESASNGASG